MRAEGTTLEVAIREAARVRLRPILMTTLCTLFGLLPLALGIGAGSEMQRPLALAVIGGLALSTPITLFAVPTLLVWGKDDRITPSDVAERFHARIRGSQLVYLPNCGHAPMLERPEAFNAAVGDWLVETRARRALLGERS